jgi:molybdate transport system substrate-binding protein
MKISHFTAISIVLLAAIIFAGCMSEQVHPENAEEELTVFVAASLTGALTDIAKQYEILYPNIRIITNFDGSQALRTQIEQGADADLFLSANTKQMNALRDQGLMENGSITLFAKNKLAVITPASNPGNITTLHDLARPGIRLVIGTKDVPVGDYARQILNKMANDPAYGPSYNTSVLANVMSEETAVTGVVAKVLLGEADAGIVYTSDITPENRDRFIVITIPDTFNVIAEYPAGIVAASQHKEEAAAFLAHLRGEQGRATLAKYGFALP